MSLSVLYLGMRGAYSKIPLKALIDAGQPICAVIVPSWPTQPTAQTAYTQLRPPPTVGDLPMRSPFMEQSIIHLGWQHQIPVFQVERIGLPETISKLASLEPDVAVVACYPEIVTSEALAIAPHGFMNLHPSRLPDFRGPDPLFWSFRAGVEETGVTLHMMDRSADSGPIVKQAALKMPEGISGGDAERLCAELGAELMVEALAELSEGIHRSWPQPAGGSYQSWPTASDFQLSLSWTAKRAFNFMKATAARAVPYGIEAGEAKLVLVEAISHREAMPEDPILRQQGRAVWIRFAEGVLHGLAGY